MAISEPATLLTDYVLGALAGFLAWRMVSLKANIATRYWALALAAIAGASFAGGTYHGFAPAMSPSAAASLWKTTTLAMGLASFCLTASAIGAAFHGSTRRLLLSAAAIKLTIYAWWMLRHDAFLYVICDYGSALLFVLILVAANRLHGEAGHRASIGGGILVSAVAAVMQQSGIRMHRHFNHNDLMHVIQMGGVWLLYRGGSRLRDAGEPHGGQS